MPAKLEVAFFQVGRLHCCCCCVNQVVVMLVGIYHDLVGIYHDEKIREVCIKVRLPPALLPFKGQVTEQTTVKWSGKTSTPVKTAEYRSIPFFNSSVYFGGTVFS